MKKAIKAMSPGDIIELAGIKFVVLEDRGPVCSDSTESELFILALESQGQSTFGDTNNYAESKLKEAVDNWLYRLTEKLVEVYGCDCAHIKHRVIDLTTLDGYKGFGSLEVAAAPLTLDEARKYAEVMPDPDEASWLATGWSGPEHFGSAVALFVYSNGSWYSNFCSNSYGIRPALVISSLLLASVDGEDNYDVDLSRVSNEALFRELERRLAGCESPKEDEEEDE